MKNISLTSTSNGFYYIDDIPQDKIERLLELCAVYDTMYYNKPTEFCFLFKTQRYQGRIVDYHTPCGLEVVLDLFHPKKTKNTVLFSSPIDVKSILKWLPESQIYVLFFVSLSGSLANYLRSKSGYVRRAKKDRYSEDMNKRLSEVLAKKQIPWDGDQKPRPTNGVFLRPW